jgi:hypothetical protein
MFECEKGCFTSSAGDKYFFHEVFFLKLAF